MNKILNVGWGDILKPTPKAISLGIAPRNTIGIFVGTDKTGDYLKVVKQGGSTVFQYHPSFWNKSGRS